jgi:hypothetical protein
MFVDRNPASAVDPMILEGFEATSILSNGDEM